MPYTIGIDLGTTHSCVAVYKNRKVEIIPNDCGNRTTPSFVSFSNTEILVGDAAKNQAARNSANTVYDVKRLIGRSYEDHCVQSDRRLWPFKVIEKESKPWIQVQHKKKTRDLAPSPLLILTVTAVERSTNNTNTITITSLKNGLSEEDIQKMIRKANEYKM